MATQARPEAFAFLLVSGSLLLAMQERWFWSAFFGALAVESHPAAALGCFWLLPQLLQSPLESARTRRNWLFAGMGGTVAVLAYLVLHRPYLADLAEALRGGSESLGLGRHFAIEYFFRTKYLRHLPELLIFAMAAFFYFRSANPLRRLAGPLPTMVLVVGSLLLSRPNFHYMVYLYPLPVLWYVGVSCSGNVRGSALWRWSLPALYLALGALVILKNHDYSSAEWNRALAQGSLVTQGRVVGPPEAWFILKDRLILCSDPGELSADRQAAWVLTTQDGPCSLNAPGGFLKKVLTERSLLPAKLPEATFRRGVVFSWSEVGPERSSDR
jgi:hypothetical protein